MKKFYRLKEDGKTSSFRTFFFILIASFITAFLLFYYHDESDSEQSLTYFPDDPALFFEKASTNLKIQSGTPYTLQWKVESIINKPTYLRQDVSLLFKDQKLIGILSQWKENTNQLSQRKDFKENESGYFEAITVHHAENHYPQNVIRGKEVMSFDHLSVMNESGNFTSFKIPSSANEKNWSTEKWHTLQLKQKSLTGEASKKYLLNLDDYYIIPLSRLHVYDTQALPGLSQKKTHRVISQLWEGIYKDYCLGVHLTESDIRSPIDSNMPIILFSKKANELFIIIQLNTGEITLLKQEV